MQSTTKTDLEQQNQQPTCDFRLGVLVDYFNAQSPKALKSARVYEAFLKMIENSYWTPDDQIPSERQLSEILPVGLSTVQTALRRLASSGLIERRRKAGSFICQPAAIGRELANFLFLGSDGKEYLPVTDVELDVFETREQGAWSTFIGPAARYVCIERVMSINDEFRIYNKLYLGDAKFRPLLNFTKSDLKELSFRILFHDRFGTPPISTDRRVQFTRLTDEIASKLEREQNEPALLYEIRQFTVRNAPLFFMQTIIPENARTLRVCASAQ